MPDGNPNTINKVSGIDKKHDGGMLLLVRKLVRPYRKWLVLIFFAMMVETAMGLAAPWPLKIIIDNVIGNEALPGWLAWIHIFSPDESSFPRVLALAAALSIVLFTVIGAMAGYIDNYYTESVAQNIANDLRRRVYHHLQWLSLSYYDTHQTGQLLSTITSDVSTVQDFASSTLLSMLIDILTIVGMLILMFYLKWDFALIAIAVTPFVLLLVSRFKKTIKKATREVRKDQSSMVTILQEGLESIRVVNAFSRQDWEEERLKKISTQTLNAALRARRIKSLLPPLVAVTVSVCTALVLFRGTDLALRNVLTVGTLTVFISYMGKFFSPVQDLAKLSATVAQATVSLERIGAILQLQTVVTHKPGAINPAHIQGEVAFKNVFFSYVTGIPVLQNITLTIRPGQRIGVCGPTGCGKSTFISLIPRFYDPVSGSVSVDGTNITDYDLEGLREQIGFVLQDTVLFYGSIYDNIAYGRPDATRDEIVAAAKLAHAHEFIVKMPQEYETLVGERGFTLSGGQRQRVGIARALVRNAPILILDEPTASLDPESEKLVMDALEKLMKGRTVITVAHRLSTIADADKIIVLKDGSIAETGTHKELIANGHIYTDLYRIQSGDAYRFSN